MINFTNDGFSYTIKFRTTARMGTYTAELTYTESDGIDIYVTLDVLSNVAYSYSLQDDPVITKHFKEDFPGGCDDVLAPFVEAKRSWQVYKDTLAS